MLDVPGEDLPHVTHYYNEAHPYYRQRVVIVGGKNSACEAALEIHRAGAHVTMVHRGAEVRRLGEVLGEARHREPHQGRLDRRRTSNAGRRDPRRPRSWSSTAGEARDDPGRRRVAADRLSRRSRVHARTGVELDADTLAPALTSDTYETNVPDLFVAGGQLAGTRTGTVFIENGRFHGEQIAKAMAARLRDA